MKEENYHQKSLGIFITGTDTNVGKTFVSSALVKRLVKKGIRTAVMKPLETGCRVWKKRYYPVDTLTLKKACLIDEPLTLINPYSLKNPLAPYAAAEVEGITIERKKIKKAFLSLASRYEFVLVEGAGGLMVPIKKDYLMADMARDIGLPLVIVARPSLGTINHTLLTIHAARSWSLKINGIIINYASPSKIGIAEKTNPHIIEKFGGVPILGTVPHHEDSNNAFERILDKIADTLFPTTMNQEGQ